MVTDNTTHTLSAHSVYWHVCKEYNMSDQEQLLNLTEFVCDDMSSSNSICMATENLNNRSRTEEVYWNIIIYMNYWIFKGSY